MTLKSLLWCVPAVCLLAACEKEVILQGERFDVRAPLEDSLPTKDRPHPVDQTGKMANKSVPVSLPAMVANADWPQRGGNVRHLAPHGRLSAAPSLVWSASIGTADSWRNRISVAPVVAEGRVYTMDAQMGVQATALNGGKVWHVNVTPAGDKPSEVSGGGLAYGAGLLFVSTSHGELIALQPATGKVQWRQKINASMAGAPAVDGRVVYVAGRDSSAWAIDAQDGKVLWQIDGAGAKVGMVGSSAPAVNEAGVYFPTVAGQILAARKGGGSELWKANIMGERRGRGYGSISDITGDPVIAGSVIYTGTAAGETYAVDAQTGETLWRAGEGAMAAVQPAGGSLFLVNDQNRLVRLDARTGAVVWSVEMPYYVKDNPRKHRTITAHYGPVLAGGRIVVASSDGALRLFSPQDGRFVGQAHIPGGAAAQPALAGGMLFVVGKNGQLHAFR